MNGYKSSFPRFLNLFRRAITDSTLLSSVIPPFPKTGVKRVNVLNQNEISGKWKIPCFIFWLKFWRKWGMRMNRYCPAAAKINTCQSKRSNSLGSAFCHIFSRLQLTTRLGCAREIKSKSGEECQRQTK